METKIEKPRRNRRIQNKQRLYVASNSSERLIDSNNKIGLSTMAGHEDFVWGAITRIANERGARKRLRPW